MTQEALKELLEAVEEAIQAGDWKVDGACDPDTAISRARKALAQTQEPVVFCRHWIDRWGCNHYADPKEPYPVNAKPLYTTPPQRSESPGKPSAWVGLTDEDIDAVTDAQWAKGVNKPIYAAHRAYARAIETKLKEKNT